MHEPYWIEKRFIYKYMDGSRVVGSCHKEYQNGETIHVAVDAQGKSREFSTMRRAREYIENTYRAESE